MSSRSARPANQSPTSWRGSGRPCALRCSPPSSARSLCCCRASRACRSSAFCRWSACSRRGSSRAGFCPAARYLPSAKTQERRRAALPEARNLHRSLARALRGLPYRADAFAPFERDVEAARLGRLLTIEDLRGTGLDLKVQSLLATGDGEWHALIPLRGVRDPARLRSLAEGLPAETRASFLGLKAESNRLIGGYRYQALALAGLGALAIAF